MKRIIRIFSIILLLEMVIFASNTYAVGLNSLDIQVSQETVRPGDEVTVSLRFGQNLSSYLISVAYDSNIFDYISSDGGTPTDTGDKVKLAFYDNTNEVSARNSANITFRAKAELTTSNPTNFAVCLEELKSADGTLNFDSITTPITKNLLVEPEYIDYAVKLEYIGDIIKDEEKEIKISYSSPIGKYYANARLVATATTPEGADVQILARDTEGTVYDIVESGWGDESGFEMGGRNYAQVLQTTGVFDEVGDYNINLKLIDKANSDEIIAERSFAFTVGEPIITDMPMTTSLIAENESNLPSTDNVTPISETEATSPTPEVKADTQNSNVTPKSLPKTGTNVYAITALVLIALLGGYIYYCSKER